MKKSFYFFLLAVVSCLGLASCSETKTDEGEYTDWQRRNEVFFDSVYHAAKTKVANGATDWKVVKKWSLNAGVATKSVDHIVVQVLKKGEGTAMPFYNDTVKIQYQARLIPSKTYRQGWVFDGTFKDEYQPQTAAIIKRVVSGSYMVGDKSVAISDGVVTALTGMKVGERVRVYIPYQLGYGTSTHSVLLVPAYSTLIYDITLVAFGRVGSVI